MIMKQFIGGLLLGIGVGFLISGLVASSLVSDFENTLTKYDTLINTFYAFTHSYSFQTIQDLTTETAELYKGNPLLRQALETVGMGQIGQLFQDLDENFKETITISEDLYNVRSSVKETRTLITYLEIGGIVFILTGAVIAVWAYRQSHMNR